MRYYDIQITQPGQTTLYRHYTSYPQIGTTPAANVPVYQAGPNGVVNQTPIGYAPAGATSASAVVPNATSGNGIFQNDPGALNVVIDAYVQPFAVPAQSAVVQVWGVPIKDIAQASNFTGCSINVYAGFQKGMPLNNPAQAGLILSGMIYQSYGNWQGTDMTLDFVVVFSGAIAAQQSNIILAWPAGTPLATTLASTLTTAFPMLKQTINISPKLVINHTQWGAYSSIVPFAQQLKPVTQQAIGGTYPGVDIVLTPTGFRIFDGSTPTTPTQIAFQDLIGQATWIQNQTIQFTCPMRADLNVSDYIQMPKNLLQTPGAVVTTSASQPQARQASVFNGTFMINSVHHMGNFRQPDGRAWVTVFQAVASA